MTHEASYVSLETSCSLLKTTNPTLLGAIADQLCSIVEPESEFNPETIYVNGNSDPDSRPPVTYLDISKYFRKATGKFVPVLFETPYEVVESRTVMVNREWLRGKVEAARERLGQIQPAQVETVHSSQILKMANASFYSVFEDQPAALDARGYKDLQKRLEIQNDQRKAQVAASKDAIARRDAEEQISVLKALLIESQSKEKVVTEENRSLYNELRAKDRKIQEKKQQIGALSEKLSTFATCFNPHHPLHPPKLMEAFECWQTLTKNGEHNPSGPGGRGSISLVLDWLHQRGDEKAGTLKIPSAKTKRLSVIVGWRGLGSGAIRSK
ncbi:hypothetical protein [Pseudomonas sp. Irchel s3a18]|uniref:hypothetical protein n=1 Tax=Pseudomonas sp. Irchel s3a18 TaxID=2009053 RepID=UPI00117B8360|nr:hypothetical protein [Pseudomonas sp. Irchel s3a18]